MKKTNLLMLILGLFACGLIAAGCGDDDSDDSGSDAATTEATTEEEAPAEEPAEEEPAEEEESSESSSSGGATPEDVLAACEDLIAGTPAEAAGQAGCEAAADALEQCLTEADDVPEDEGARETFVAACEDAADQALAALEAAG